MTHRTWLDEYVIVDGYIISYALVDPGQPLKLSGHPDSWEPGYGPSCEVTEILDQESGDLVTYEQLQQAWTMSEGEVMEYIDEYIARDVEGA